MDTAHFSLQNRRIFISGSSSGIGAATAKMAAERGARVIVHGRDRERTEGVAAEIVASGGEAIALIADISSDAEVNAMAAEVHDRFGGIDILVSNAGDANPFSSDWFAVSPDDWLASYNRNVVAAVRLTQHFVPGMRERGWGRVILIGSNAYTRPPVDFPAYPPGKAALVNLAISLAKVLSNTGVTANIVSPGGVMTETLASNLLPMAQAMGWTDTDPAVIERRLTTEKWPNLVGRLARPEEIAATILFVASDMAGYMTGSNIRIDGGDGLSMH